MRLLFAAALALGLSLPAHADNFLLPDPLPNERRELGEYRFTKNAEHTYTFGEGIAWASCLARLVLTRDPESQLEIYGGPSTMLAWRFLHFSLSFYGKVGWEIEAAVNEGFMMAESASKQESLTRGYEISFTSTDYMADAWDAVANAWEAIGPESRLAFLAAKTARNAANAAANAMRGEASSMRVFIQAWRDTGRALDALLIQVKATHPNHPATYDRGNKVWDKWRRECSKE